MSARAVDAATAVRSGRLAIIWQQVRGAAVRHEHEPGMRELAAAIDAA